MHFLDKRKKVYTVKSLAYWYTQCFTNVHFIISTTDFNKRFNKIWHVTFKENMLHMFVILSISPEN